MQEPERVIVGWSTYGDSSVRSRRRSGDHQSKRQVGPSQTLRSLVGDGLVVRRVEPSVPPRVFYRLTPLGLSLEAPLAALRLWAEDHMAEIDGLER